MSTKVRSSTSPISKPYIPPAVVHASPSHTSNQLKDLKTRVASDPATEEKVREDKTKSTEEEISLVYNQPRNELLDFTVSHPFQNSWTLWYDGPWKKGQAKSWKENLHKIMTFGTVEDFWRLWNNLRPVHLLKEGSNFHLFKEGIEPAWEDPANEKGGKWLVSLPQKHRAAYLSQFWLYVVLACVGEAFECDEVCGVVVSVRAPNDRIALWTKDSENVNACLSIGRKLKETVEFPSHEVIGYQAHADSIRTNSSFSNKHKYEV
eukprot:TRINITY_DN2676_c0_g2_i1.p1 TRINITY_DN2676_c0_g2~~TRINITY_DN2676_c0_g2_i1.p1  ORF type:complete len:263 (+),score=42.16 TRINITY_DN2676_c0_g2_i1:87-875(+)